MEAVTTDVLSLFVNFLSGLFIGGTLIYAGRQVALGKRVQEQNHDWNRRFAAQEATISYASKIQGAEKLNKALGYAKTKKPIPLIEIQEAFDKNEELRTICHHVLNYHESLCVGVLNNVYDEQVIKNIRKSPITLLFKAFEEYILEDRRKLQPTAYEIQQKLIAKWLAEEANTETREATG